MLGTLLTTTRFDLLPGSLLQAPDRREPRQVWKRREALPSTTVGACSRGCISARPPLLGVAVRRTR